MASFFQQHRGGKVGYGLRRIIHFSMAIIPIVYYGYGSVLAGSIGLKRETLVVMITLAILLFEGLRLWRGWVIIGQRAYEAKQPSAVAWGSLGIALVLLLAPPLGYLGAGVGAPILWTLAIVDPFIGEARRLAVSNVVTITLAAIIIGFIWLGCSVLLGTPRWVIPLIIPMTLIAEWLNLPYVDDNFTLCVLPLITLKILLTFYN